MRARERVLRHAWRGGAGGERIVTPTPCGAESPEVKSDSYAQSTEPPRRPLETALSEDSPIWFPEHLLRRSLCSSALRAPAPGALPEHEQHSGEPTQ